ncbi:MAG: N-acetyl-gamma-glutamyl-phosphate reductase [Treponema sp.]|nr:N-acetyl-gamma-glutamyl-phosphate reductase [Treponema sp.]
MVAGVIGAAGYAGAELVRLLAGHPRVRSLSLGSVSLEGGWIQNVYPNFLEKVSYPLEKPEEVVASSDVVFAALPHGVGEPYAKTCLEKGISFIDLSADFRFDADEETFKAWYGKGYAFAGLRKHSVYGLPELNRDRIKTLAAAGPVIIGNPGCYPTGASLGIFPALATGLAAAGTIIVNSASGVTGAGREPQKASHFSECSDSMSPYKVGAHRHCPEISRNIRNMAELFGREAPPLVFTPHLAPMNRGILSTIYIPLADEWQAARADSVSTPRPPSGEIEAKALEIREVYAAFYKDEPFARVLPQGVMASTGRLRQSNFCDISVNLDQGGSMLIVVTAIDNMMKGAAGQAIHNMNIIMGFDETDGIGAIPALF